MTKTDETSIIRQLRAEIAAAYPNTKSFAEAAGIDYTTLARYLRGDRELRLSVLFQCLDLLGIAPSVFFARAEGRRRGPLDAEEWSAFRDSRGVGR